MENELEEEVRMSLCSGCGKFHDSNTMLWVNDNYGIPFKLSCNDCYDEVEASVNINYYGDDMDREELYGTEDDFPEDPEDW